MEKDIIRDIIFNAGAIVVIVSFVFGSFKFIFEYFNIKSKNRHREEFRTSFNQIVSNLSSKDRTTQLASAILLRRFLVKEVTKIDSNLINETVNVISSLIRTLPTGIFQKTLADGLSCAADLSMCDFQKSNFQDVLLGNEDHKIKMYKTDLFLADFSYANVRHIIGHNIYFYRSILFCTRFKHCDFSNGDFRGADLTGVHFEDCILKDANFKGAINIPFNIKTNLRDGIFIKDGAINACNESDNGNIFFSMPGIMSKSDEFITKEYKRILEERGFNVIYYTSDKYPGYGQFNKVRVDIQRSVGMVAFGFKQIKVEKAKYRPNTIDFSVWNSKWLSTPWSEIEVGMGLMKGMPILLVSDPEICDGVFDNKLSECFVANISTAEDCRKLEQNWAFENWISKIENCDSLNKADNMFCHIVVNI